MALEKKAYKALESVVGPENISEDSAILASYNYGPLGGALKTGDFLPFPPVAAVLPGSTEEVQGVVKVCNRYHIKYKAHSTGFSAAAMPGMENVVMVDLRRMNRIVELDGNNMYTIIEPYVTAGQLQAEAMKKGLNCHIVGAGAGHSPLASAAACWGIGTSGISTSCNQRNLLGVEWVLPTGEVLRIGSPGSGSGWFSGDGPGPDLRGIMKGFVGTFGGLGIFTKIGYKLYPWPGPARTGSTGRHPQIGMKMPENFKYYHPFWDSWENVMEATYRIHEAEIAYFLCRVPPDHLGWCLTETNNEFARQFEEGTLPIQRKHRKGYSIIIAGSNKEEFEYRKKVFEKIVADTNGEYVPFTPEQEEVLMVACIKSTYIPRVFRPTAMFASSFGQFESVGLMEQVMTAAEGIMEKYVQPGKEFIDHGPEGFWGWSTEGRHWWQENAYGFDGTDLESINASAEHNQTTLDLIANSKGKMGGLGQALQRAVFGPNLDVFGPRQSNVHLWIRKIKNAFDPNASSDHSMYISPEPPDL
jgi:glycolate oxidase